MKAVRVAAAVFMLAWLAGVSVPTAQASPSALSLSVVQNRLVNGSGLEVHLTGVNRAGTEYACIQGWGVFDGPSDDRSVAAIAGWGANAVRIGLNEDCWLGINGASPRYSGSAYRQAITQYVQLLHQHGLYAIVALMWTAPAGNPATWQEAMANADHATAFWSSVASTFRDDQATLFELYGEPAFISWSCWADGCSYSDKYGTWQTAGMGSMLKAVRDAGSKNVVLLSGTSYANDLGNWLEYAPSDPARQLGASFHLYGDNTCGDASCWNASVKEVAMRVPVVTSELGERVDGSDCGHSFVDRYISYARSNGISYLAWTWDTWNQCSMLVLDYSGTPTAFGADYRSRLSDGVPFSDLAYTSSMPPRPLFEVPPQLQHERLWAAVCVLLLSFGVVVWLASRRRTTARA